MREIDQIFENICADLEILSNRVYWEFCFFHREMWIAKRQLNKKNGVVLFWLWSGPIPSSKALFTLKRKMTPKIPKFWSLVRKYSKSFFTVSIDKIALEPRQSLKWHCDESIHRSSFNFMRSTKLIAEASKLKKEKGKTYSSTRPTTQSTSVQT